MKTEFKENEVDEALQRLSRESFKLRMINDINFDMTVCGLINANPSEYLGELKEIIDYYYFKVIKRSEEE